MVRCYLLTISSKEERVKDSSFKLDAVHYYYVLDMEGSHTFPDSANSFRCILELEG